MLEKTFDPAAVEPRLYEMWEKSGVFAPSDAGEAFSIVIPPPNVTVPCISAMPSTTPCRTC